jgi:hypothetical protein
MTDAQKNEKLSEITERAKTDDITVDDIITHAKLDPYCAGSVEGSRAVGEALAEKKAAEKKAVKKAAEKKAVKKAAEKKAVKKSRGKKPYFARTLTAVCYGKETKNIDETKPAFQKWFNQPISHPAARAAYEMSREAFRTAEKLSVSEDFKLALRKNAYTLLRKALTIQTEVNSEAGKREREKKNLKTPEQIRAEIDKAVKRADDLKLRLAAALKSA